jgi:hypothetical protein
MRWIKYIFGFLFLTTGFSQSLDFDLKVIKATLPQYLNTGVNSMATFLKGNKGYELFKRVANPIIFLGSEEDKAQQKIGLQKLDLLSDSIAKVLSTEKIIVLLENKLYGYSYNHGINNYKNNKEWEANYGDFLKDFEENELVRFDTIIGRAYLDLVKQQIDIKFNPIPLDLKSFDTLYYQFEPLKDSINFKMPSRLLAYRLYKPVFNRELNKGCYLFSSYCRNNEICRDFIFVKKVKNKWIYVDNYPTHLIESE